MGLSPKTIADYGVGNTSWIGSRHAVAEAATGTLKASAFAEAEGVTDGVVPSGYPVAMEDGFLVPFDGDEEGGNELYGFTLYDRDISDGDEPTAYIWHGRITVANLPITFDAEAATGSAFVFDNEGV